MVSSLSDQTPRFLTLFYVLIRFSREPGKNSNFLCSRHLLNVLGPFFQTAEVKPIEASGMDLDDAKDKLEVKDKAVKDLSSEEMTSKVMANNTKYIEARIAKKSQTQGLNFMDWIHTG